MLCCYSAYLLLCACGPCTQDSYLDEVITDDAGGRMYVCSDTDFCAARQAEGHRGRLSGEDAA